MRRFLTVLLATLPTLAFADQVVLKGGRTVTGIFVERTARGVVLDVGPGRVTIPNSEVEHVVTGDSTLAAYRDRARAIPSGDARTWVDLGLWAQERGLLTQAREAFLHAVAIDPGNAAAQTGLGHVRLGDEWVTPEESYRARGFVPFEGAWITPAERESLLRERAVVAEGEQARREAEARAREAEARAEAAEAEARAASQAAPVDTGGIPYPYVFGGGGYCHGYDCGLRPLPPFVPETRPPIGPGSHPPRPAPPPRPRSDTPPPKQQPKPSQPWPAR